MNKTERRDAVNYIERFLETHDIAYVYEHTEFPLISCYDRALTDEEINEQGVFLINVFTKKERLY